MAQVRQLGQQAEERGAAPETVQRALTELKRIFLEEADPDISFEALNTYFSGFDKRGHCVFADHGRIFDEPMAAKMLALANNPDDLEKAAAAWHLLNKATSVAHGQALPSFPSWNLSELKARLLERIARSELPSKAEMLLVVEHLQNIAMKEIIDRNLASPPGTDQVPYDRENLLRFTRVLDELSRNVFLPEINKQAGQALAVFANEITTAPGYYSYALVTLFDYLSKGDGPLLKYSTSGLYYLLQHCENQRGQPYRDAILAVGQRLISEGKIQISRGDEEEEGDAETRTSNAHASLLAQKVTDELSGYLARVGRRGAAANPPPSE